MLVQKAQKPIQMTLRKKREHTLRNFLKERKKEEKKKKGQ
jgi:rRNA processing protein Krr1/Pno1